VKPEPISISPGFCSATVAVEYKSQDYAGPRLDTVGGVAGPVSLTWTPTGLATVSAFVTREIIESTAGAVVFKTNGRLVPDHELLRNLLLQARVLL
jgi:hypothetical protein